MRKFDKSRANGSTAIDEFMIKQTDWFQSWFNTKYYHILYKNRDFEEAQRFIEALLTFLSPASNARFMDLACGKGRHSKYLNSKGFNVVGTDLSEASILDAKKDENETLQFVVNDMRNEIEGYQFDFILNLFTSFGYFDSKAEDQKVIQSAANMMRKDGKLVIDFINIEKAIANLCPYEIKTIDGIDFQIKKFMEEGFIKKEINFTDNDSGQKYNFLEKVKVLYQDDFEVLLQKSNLKVEHVFGDYELNAFDPQTSDRLIFVASK